MFDGILSESLFPNLSKKTKKKRVTGNKPVSNNKKKEIHRFDLPLSPAQYKIYMTLKKCKKMVAELLSKRPDLLDICSDDFYHAFMEEYPPGSYVPPKGKDRYSMESIRRSRAHLQNKDRIFPKTKDDPIWTDAIRKLNRETEG